MTDNISNVIRWNANFMRGLAQSVLDRARVIRGSLAATKPAAKAAKSDTKPATKARPKRKATRKAAKRARPSRRSNAR